MACLYHPPPTYDSHSPNIPHRSLLVSRTPCRARGGSCIRTSCTELLLPQPHRAIRWLILEYIVHLWRPNQGIPNKITVLFCSLYNLCLFLYMENVIFILLMFSLFTLKTNRAWSFELTRLISFIVVLLWHKIVPFGSWHILLKCYW